MSTRKVRDVIAETVITEHYSEMVSLALKPSRTRYPHIPADVRAAIDKYDADVQSGRITFDHGKFADIPAESDAWLRDYLNAHIPADMM